MRLEDKERYFQIRIHGLRCMLESDRPQVLLEGSFQKHGFQSEIGLDDIFMRVSRWLLILSAKHSGWTDEDIKQSLEGGRSLARLYKEISRQR